MNHNNILMFEKAPAPFTNEELIKYFIRMEDGDKQARDEIIKHNIRLVISEVKRKFVNSIYDQEELLSVGFIGLIKSVDTFDRSKNIKFCSYSVKCIDNEILMFLRNNKKYTNDVSVNAFLTKTDDSTLMIEETLEDADIHFVQDYENKCINEEIVRVINNLSLRDQNIIKMYFGFDRDIPMSQKEIAEFFGVSQSYISRLVIKNIKKLTQLFQKEGIIEKRDYIKIKKKVLDKVR